MAFGGDVRQSEQPASRRTPPAQKKQAPVSNAGVLGGLIQEQKDAVIVADVQRRRFQALLNQIEKFKEEQRWADKDGVQALQAQINDVARKILNIDPHYDLQSLGIDKDML